MSTVMPGSFHPSESFQLRVPSMAHVRRIRSNSVQHRNSSSISSNEEFTRLNEEMFRLDAPYGEDARDPRHEHGETNYINMLLQLDSIPETYNILAGLFTWLLLAGYMVLPATFTSLQNSRTIASEVSKAGKLVLKTYQNLPLLWIAAIFCAIGASGMSWLWWMWKRNYVWILNRIILPGFLHSITGLLTTIINIYTARSGAWSVTAIITITVTGCCTVFLLASFLIYNFWLLQNVKKEHKKKVLELSRLRSIRSAL
ncbi:hypothetical protein sscle_11g081380 [Sclerotinia sclerotiorum 1980 UF-70]|uniref:Uncharacterized protein n=1 Tax=Sclerotinia sclerotiorum (strain ATCC 18683 / 1980 / Ss-1) TaxID=665079 RepID=A0A1D9QEP6_SCLS1|nr:hypothetical protein sscle_11g081380 [Sclerotinia sclerotiorum 1980 UF-70]